MENEGYIAQIGTELNQISRLRTQLLTNLRYILFSYHQKGIFLTF